MTIFRVMLVACLLLSPGGFGSAQQGDVKKDRPAAPKKEIVYRGRTVKAWGGRLRSSDEETRERALLVLETLGQDAKDAIPELIGLWRLSKGAHDETAPRVAKVLVNIGPAAVPRLIALLKEKELSNDVGFSFSRPAVAAALGNIGPAAAPALGEIVQHQDRNVRHQAFWALEQLGPNARTAVPALIEALKNGKDEVRWYAALALARIGPEARSAVPALIEALKDKEKEVRIYAAQALRTIADPASKAALNAAFMRETDFRARRDMAFDLLLVDPDHRQALALLLDHLKHKDAGVREFAISLLGVVGAKAREAVPLLNEILKKEMDPSKRLDVVRTLVRIDSGQPDALSLLLASLKDKNVNLRRIGENALYRLGPQDRGAIPILTEALNKETDAGIRRMLAGMLWRIHPGQPEAQVVLLKALNDEEFNVQSYARWALGESNPELKTSVPVLTEILKKETDVKVRRSLAKLLVGFEPGHREAVAVLLDALKDKDKIVRYVAAWALVGSATQDAVPALIDALKDKDLNVSRGAAEALARIAPKNKAALAALQKELHHPDPFINRFALEAVVGLGVRNTTLVPGLVESFSHYTGKERLDREKRNWTVKTFREIGPEGLPALLTLLKEGQFPERVRRAQVLEFLGRVDDEGKSVPVLLDILKDPKGGDKYAVAWALAWIGPAARDAVPVLLENMKKGFGEQDLMALGEIGPVSKEVVPALIEIVKGKNFISQRAAIAALGSIGPEAKAAAPVLLEALKRETNGFLDDSVRYALPRIDPEAAKKAVYKGSGF
jgi:HEAT repeat protein